MKIKVWRHKNGAGPNPSRVVCVPLCPLLCVIVEDPDGSGCSILVTPSEARTFASMLIDSSRDAEGVDDDLDEDDDDDISEST